MIGTPANGYTSFKSNTVLAYGGSGQTGGQASSGIGTTKYNGGSGGGAVLVMAAVVAAARLGGTGPETAEQCALAGTLLEPAATAMLEMAELVAVQALALAQTAPILVPLGQVAAAVAATTAALQTVATPATTELAAAAQVSEARPVQLALERVASSSSSTRQTRL